MITEQPRTPAGSPAGGQFAGIDRPESTVALAMHPQVRLDPLQARDVKAMNEIARILGQDEEWHGTADYTTDIADAIAATGRPHPGDRFVETDDGTTVSDAYLDELRQFCVFNPAPADPRAAADYRRLNQIAETMAGCRWDSDTMEWLAGDVQDSGRPNPGADLHGAEYEDALHTWGVETGCEDPDGRDHIARLAVETDLPAVAHALSAVRDRGDVDDTVFAHLSGERAEELYAQHVSPMADGVATYAREASGYAREHELEPAPLDGFVERVREEASEGGWPLAGELALLAHERGDVSTRALRFLGSGDYTEIGETVLGPGLDGLEAALRSGPRA